MSKTQGMTHEQLHGMLAVLDDVRAERHRQHETHGEQTLDLGQWLMVLVEEVGEVAAEMQKAVFEGEDVSDLRKELVQVAAVAVQIVESLDRAVNS